VASDCGFRSHNNRPEVGKAVAEWGKWGLSWRMGYQRRNGSELVACFLLAALWPQPVSMGPVEDAAVLVGVAIDSPAVWVQASAKLAAAGFGDLSVDAALTAARLDPHETLALEEAGLLVTALKPPSVHISIKTVPIKLIPECKFFAAVRRRGTNLH